MALFIYRAVRLIILRVADLAVVLPVERHVSGRQGWAGEISGLFEHPEGFLPLDFMKHYKTIFRKRNAFPMTETELKVMAALAIMGLKSTPTNG